MQRVAPAAELNWLSFPNRVKYHLRVMMYKALNNLAPTYLTDLFTTTSKIHDRSLRSVENETLRVPFARTSYYENSFTVNGAKQWNSLPVELRQTTSLRPKKKQKQQQQQQKKKKKKTCFH